MALLDLPQELLGHALSFLDPISLTKFRRTCKIAQAFTDPSNDLLWQSAFVYIYDHPDIATKQRNYAQRQQRAQTWHERLRRRFLTVRTLDFHTQAEFEKPLSSEEMVDVLLDMVDTSICRPTEWHLAEGIREASDQRLSSTLRMIPHKYDYIAKMDYLVRESRPALDTSAEESLGTSVKEGPTTRSMSAAMPQVPRSEAGCRLHVLAGVTQREEADRRALGAARRLVYDLTLTDSLNEWGPLKRDQSGTVDWPRLEAIMSVVVRSFSSAIRSRMILPQGFDYSIPYRTLIDPQVPQDWARVTGNWCGTYVFLNWEDLIEFNLWGEEGTRPSLVDGPEQCGGLMKLELKLDETIRDDPKIQTQLPICEDLPPLTFSGLSKSYDWSLATSVRGRVCLAPGGREVRWKFIVRYSGEDQWYMEGVQPGGVRSGCIYGTWTSCSHEPGGPVGPFVYAPEELCKTGAVALRRNVDLDVDITQL